MATNKAFENLKKIHDLQKDGEISKVLQKLKGLKGQIEELSASLSARSKVLDAEVEKKKQADQVKNEKKEETTKETEKSEQSFYYRTMFPGVRRSFTAPLVIRFGGLNFYTHICQQ